MELMTHGLLWDFETQSTLEGAPCESIWLYEPAVSRNSFRAYFENIIREGEKLRISFTGASVPGCNCKQCQQRWKQLNQIGIANVNPELWQALLALAKENKFRGSVVPCFVDIPYVGATTKRMAVTPSWPTRAEM
jgi:hypothetical protein